MRALVLTTDAFGGYGGIAQYNRDLLTAMCSYPGTSEVIALPRTGREPFAPLPPRLSFDISGLGGKGRFLAACARQLLSRGPIDLVLCGHINLLSVAYLASVRFRAPLHLMTYGIEAWRCPSRVARALVSRVDVALSISRVTADRFHEWSHLDRVPMWILPNAIDAPRFADGGDGATLVKRYGLANKKVIMTLGRMAASERMKGFDDVIDVLPRLRQKNPSLVYLIVGDGDDRPRLEAKARAAGLGEHVIFTGNIREQEKSAHYHVADLFVMPSHGEGFGFVFLEALACGVPVVASKLDGGREAVREGLLGTLVDPRDPADLERGILEALAKPRAVPDGLSYFSVANFQARAHDWLASVDKGRRT
jgi:phosphatidylinositol alpha-1,6-mannosyltransferase